MTDQSKITGKKISDLFDYLIKHKTILSVWAPGIDYERLTYVLAIDEDPRGHHLIIDLPEGFSKAMENIPDWRLGFNFNGPDKLEYLFNVHGGGFHPDGLRIPFPSVIDRLQRRKNFRVMTPNRTRMVINTENMTGLINLINISLGGAYGIIAKHNLKNTPEPILHLEQRIDKAGIIFPEDQEMGEQIIVIKETHVRRIDHSIGKRLHKYAFEFMDIEPEQLRKLTQAIYHIQRRFLMRR